MDRFPHYLKAAGSTKLPRHHTVLDVESVTEHRNGTWQQSWRLAVADHFHGYVGRPWRPPETCTYSEPWQLWTDMHSRLRPERRHVVWCHNLAYDLRVSGALAWLPQMGFELEGIALEHVAGWAKFMLDTATLLFVDLASWLPAPLAKVADDLRISPVPRPPQDAPTEQHLARCQSDVRVAREAVVQLLDMVEEYDLGPWRPTGAGQSHSAWRRRFLTHKCLVHDRLEVLEAERAASWTGRCEAWRHGRLSGEVFTEYDLDLAYCQIAADSLVPTVLMGESHTLDPGRLCQLADQYAVLAKVDISTRVECVPALADEHILWPVGQFSTVLWDPELRMAVQCGAEVQVRQAWLYRKAPALRGVAAWIMQGLADDRGGITQVQKRLLKHWARALVGRCALRYRTWELWGEAEEDDVSLGMIHDWQTGDVSELMQVGRQLRVLSEQQESPESLPQIPGWIMSECRSRLWQLMQTAGPSHLVYLDTDCLIVDGEGARRLEVLRQDGGGWPMHIKGRYGQLHVHGPRMLELDGERRMSGVPLQARMDKDGKLAGEVFLSLRESLLRHNVDTVEVLHRTYDPAGLDRRRIHLDGGETSPHVLPKAS